MFIEVIIENEIFRRVQVNLEPFDRFDLNEFRIREELIAAYIGELKILYPKADFQLAFQSRLNFLEINEE